MRLLDVFVERFGVLQNTDLRDLSDGLTVIYGANGSGKTTLVNFIHGLLFGFTTDHQAFQPADHRFGGAVSMKSKGRRFRLARERNHGDNPGLSTVDLSTDIAVSLPGSGLPEWVNETVYREVFSVGYHEAARFDLLTRLCLDGGQDSASEDEIRRTERAISECVRQREGTGSEGSLRSQMSALRSRREQLVHQLSEMRRVSPGIPARTSEVEREIQELIESLNSVDQQIGHTQANIYRLEELLKELRRQNVVSLGRRNIEDQVSRLLQRQQRWQNIRDAVTDELTGLPTKTSGLRNRDGLKSIRALVSRLEERMHALQNSRGLAELAESERDAVVDHLRSEVFSLCDYVAQHEAAVETHESSLESLFAGRTLQDAENVDALLQSQIDALRDELSRSEDVIHANRSFAADCQSAAHTEFHQHRSNRAVSGSVDTIEAELTRNRRQLDDLTGQRTQINERTRHLQAELSSLRAQLKQSASLEDLDRIKAETAETDARLALLQDQWQVLEQTEQHLRTVLDGLGQHANPQVLNLASDYIARLTDGDCFQLEGNASRTQILARTRQSSTPQTLQQLSRGTRDQAALALRLALIQCRAKDEERCPLILDDVFITADDERAEAAADLLTEVAAHGQQIIFCTCQKDLCELFARRHASVRYLEDEHVASTPLPFAEPVGAPQPVIQAKKPDAPAPERTAAAPKASEKSNWLFYLEVDNSVEDLSGLTVAELEALRASDICSIDELLTPSLDDLESRFQERGYSIGRERIRAWRGQASLATQIPMLRRSDAELLYAAGIQSTVELSRMRPETVYDLVTEFQNSQPGLRYRRSGRSVDRQQAINWSRWSQHSRSLTEARQSRSRFFVRTSDQANSPHASASSGARTSGVRQRRAGISEGGSRSRRQRRPRLTSDVREQKERRQSRRRQRLDRHSASYRTTEAEPNDSETTQELKFHLSRSSDVEAAPSIGPKTAQRLARVGVYTVDDLLTADPADVTTRLDNKRISEETIVQWQAQARLVCQIPQLRGHDAQILVACGVTEPEQLSHKRSVDLYAVVGPFADTSEGERIVRGGKKPDLEEITDWIRWAQQARSLRAAA